MQRDPNTDSGHPYLPYGEQAPWRIQLVNEVVRNVDKLQGTKLPDT